MGRINTGRVILGGLLAGLVINIGEFILNELILKDQWMATMTALNLPSEMGGSTIGLFVLLGFVVGVVMVWLYAAMRPRFGAGAGTAVRAGIAVWFVGSLIATMYPMALGMIPMGLGWTAVIWAFVEYILAAVAGAWLYKEA